MFVACARVEIHMGEVHSLKEKRQIVKSVLQRLHNTFNVSAAELGALDIWQTGVLGVACVSGEGAHANRQLDAVLRFLEEDGRFEVSHIQREFY